MFLIIILIIILIVVAVAPLPRQSAQTPTQSAQTPTPVICKVKGFNASEIQLRPVSPADIPYISQICTDPKLIRYYTLRGEPWSAERVRDYVKYSGDSTIVTKTGEFVGIIGYGVDGCGSSNDDKINSSDKFIHIIIAPDYHGCGVATHAYSKLLAMFWRDADDMHIFAKIHPDNIPSIKLHEKMGFKKTDVSGEYLIYKLNRPSDSKL